MGKLWTVQIIFLVLINISLLISCSPVDEDSLSFPNDILYPNIDQQNPFDKRLSSFVRIGRGLSSFIRIGKGDPNYAIYETEPGENEGEEEENFQKRKSAFVRIGRGNEPDYNTNPFEKTWDGGFETEPYPQPFNKRGGAFIRLGKFPSAGFVRNRSGRIHSISSPPYYRRSGRIGHSSFIRIGKRDTRDALKQMNTHEIDEDELRRYLTLQQGVDTAIPADESINTVGKGPSDKRMSSFVRIGRQGGMLHHPQYILNAKNEKENADISSETKDEQAQQATGPDEKRISSFVRIGRQSSSDGRYGYRDYTHATNTPDEQTQTVMGPDEKRMSRFVRIGRPSSSDDRYRYRDYTHAANTNTSPDEQTQTVVGPDEKRMSRFVRIGRPMGAVVGPDDKRMSSFVRIGREPFNLYPDYLYQHNVNLETSPLPDDEQTNTLDDDTQATNKRMSSFVRIGKNYNAPLQDLVSNDKRFSKFVRIGKDFLAPRDGTDQSKIHFSKLQELGENFELPDDELETNEKRFSKFVRIGKDMKLLGSSLAGVPNGRNKAMHTTDDVTDDELNAATDIEKDA